MQYVVTIATRYHNENSGKEIAKVTQVPMPSRDHAETIAIAINKATDTDYNPVITAIVSVRVYTERQSIILPLGALDLIAEEYIQERSDFIKTSR